ncbi:MAG: DUF86 domain-containing protein [Cyanobacteria bacterium P01_A01_bin.116]
MNHQIHPRDLHALLDIVHSAKIVQKYVEGVSQNSFAEDEKLQDAVIRRLLVIGEAAGRISKESRSEFPDIEWEKIRGLRNRLVHEYDDVSLKVVWEVTQTEMENLISKIEPTIPPEDQLSVF